MDTSKARGKVNTAVKPEEAAVRPGVGSRWTSLVWLGLLVAVALTVFQQLEHSLFPGWHSAQHHAVNVGIGTFAAVVGTYYSTRRLNRALWRQARAEKKLALERNVLRTVTDNIPDSIFAKDLEGRYLLANKSFATLHGVKSPQDLVGKTVFDLFPKDRANALTTDDLRVMRSGGSSMESERLAVDAQGNVKVLHTTKVPLIDKDRAVIGIVGLHRDITRRKQAEQKLLQSEASLAAAQRIAHFGSVELHIPTVNEPEKKPVRWSDEVFRIFGFEPGAVEVSRETYFRSIHPDDRENVRKALDKALQEGRPFAIQFRVVRPDGTERHILERGDIILDPETKKPLKMEASLQDVTERVEAEIRLNSANQKLAEKVQELQERSKELNLLSDMVGRLQSCNKAEEAYAEVCTKAEQLFPQWSGSLCVTNGSRSSVQTVSDWGQSGHVDRVFTPDDCWALRRGQPQLYRRGEKGPACRHIDLRTVTESICVPLMAEGEAMGIVTLQMMGAPERQKLPLHFSGEAERRLATVLAKQVGLALWNLKLRESLHNQVICDPLTGLFNRRHMEEILERECSRANRNKSSVAIVMVDLDHFKRFNDSFGHQAGDALLRALGDLLKRYTRSQDIACRYGGEEFALVLTDTSLEGTFKRAEILRQQVKQMNVEDGGKLLGGVTVSMGIAMYPEHGATMAEVLRAADQALYAAKREGRDRVSTWTAESVV